MSLRIALTRLDVFSTDNATDLNRRMSTILIHLRLCFLTVFCLLVLSNNDVVRVREEERTAYSLGVWTRRFELVHRGARQGVMSFQRQICRSDLQ